MRKYFDVGEVVHVENFGWGVIREVGWGSGNVKIIFECDVNSDIDWWFSSDRVTKLREVFDGVA